MHNNQRRMQNIHREMYNNPKATHKIFRDTRDVKCPESQNEEEQGEINQK